MLNYIRAELYKVLRRKYAYITLAVVLVLEGLLVAGAVFHNAHSLPTPFGAEIVLIVEMGAIGLCLVLLTGDMVFAGQHKNSTLKNEVSFGLSRARIYLGKLIAMTLLSVLYLVVMMGFFLGLSAAALPLEGAGTYSARDGLIIVGYFLAVGLPLWIGAQGAACMCLFLVQGELAGSFLYVALVFVLDAFVGLTGLMIGGDVGSLLLKIQSYMPRPMLDAAKYVVGDWGYLGKAWAVGLFWLAASTAIGLYGFRKKEIK